MYSPDTTPLDRDIVEDWVQPGGDCVVLAFWEDHRAAIIAVFKCLQYLRRVVSTLPKCRHRAVLAIVGWTRWR